MNDFPSNSKKQRETENKIVEKVVESEASPRKKSLRRQFKDVFIGGDSKSVFHYVMFEVLVPQVKDMVAEAATQGFERFIFGDSRSGTNRRTGSRPVTNQTNYSRYAARGNNPIGQTQRNEDRSSATARLQSHAIDDVLLSTRVEAETVLEKMYDLLQQYEQVTVADLYSLIGWSATYMDGKWGWTGLRSSEVRRVRDGYLLNFPRPQSLD